jgi:basic membrane protein A
MSRGSALVLLVSLALLGAACGDDDDAAETAATAGETAATAGETAATAGETAATAGETAATAGETAATATTDGAANGGTEGEPCPGTAGCVPANQPDVNQDGTVIVGVLSPGDTNDGGYYESFVTAAREFADEHGWEVTIIDRVAVADASQQARNLCQQDVDFVAVADTQLTDALLVAEEDVCAGVVFYLAAGEGEEPTPYYFATTEDARISQLVTGYATGLLLEELGENRAAFIGGPDLPFVKRAFDNWTAGIQLVLPEATTSQTLTGDFDDSAKGQEAATAQVDQGAAVVYTYLGGATDATAQAAAQEGALSIAPGTDRCDQEVFGLASIFSPGDFFAAALNLLNEGKVQMAETIEFQVGIDPVPTTIVCGAAPNAETIQAQVDEFIADIGSGEFDVDAVIVGT